MSDTRHGKHKYPIRTVSGIPDEEYALQQECAKNSGKTWSAWIRELANSERMRVRP